MDEADKNLLENLKNFDLTTLFKKNVYCEIINRDPYSVIQGFILNEKEKQNFDIYIPKYRGNTDLPITFLNLLGENKNIYKDDIKLRTIPINFNLSRAEMPELINSINTHLLRCNIILNGKNNNGNSNINEKDNNSSTSTLSSTNTQYNNNPYYNKIKDKNGNIIDYTGYITYQFLEGFLLDCFAIIKDKLNNNQNISNLFIPILDIIIYCAGIVKSNLNKYKSAYYNKKLLIVNQVHAILLSFDSLIYNLTPFFRYNYKNPILEKKLTEIGNLVYDIILASKNKNLIPLQILINFIQLICFDKVKDSKENYDKKEIYDILNEHMRNLDKNELIYFKKDSSMREICNNLVSNLFDTNMEAYIDETYYSYLLSCLKCNNLEKKMNALNDISNIINEFQDNKKIDIRFKDFIDKNNILDIFFEDSIHDEIIKRSINLFTYFAKYNYLSDNIIEKIIQRQSNNDIMKKILIEIVSQLPKEKKDLLFNRLSKGLKFDIENTNNIEYILNLTVSCLNSCNIIRENEAKDKKNDEDIDIDENETQKENNYYGLKTIFDYIIKDFNDKIKFDKNNIDIALNSFVETILSIKKSGGVFGMEDIFFFVEKLFENIKMNDKHNSIIQSIKIIYKLFDNLGRKKSKINFIKNLKNLDEKYDIISLLITDLIRYMKILPNDYSNENGKNNIYEGIYPHFKNVVERLNLIFYFFNKNVHNYGLKLEDKKHLEKIYEIFKCEKFNDERKYFYSIINKNISLIDNLILMEFFQNILKNKNEFDLKLINDNESTNLVIQMFKQININKKAIIFDGRNIRIEEDAIIEGIDMLFDLLTENPSPKVQDKISELLSDVCLSHKNYNENKLSEYWKKYFNKINLYLDSIINTNNKIALNGIIKLINKIYSSSNNLCKKIAKKNDFKSPKDSYKLYNFIKINTKKDQRLRVGKDDNLIDIRWKISYYFKIPVNNVAFIDINENIYTLNDDFDNFMEIFSDDKYFNSKEYIKIKEIPFGLLEMKDNPKLLIENNDKIYNILINNLKNNSNNSNENNNDNFDSNRQKIWNIIIKLPKTYYFKNKLQKFGNKEKIDDNELLDIFNIKEIYIMTYSLQCLYFVLFDKNNENNEQINKNEYLTNFIEVYHLDKILLNRLLDININPNNCHPITIECLISIIQVLYELEIYNENKMKIEEGNFINDDNLFNNILKKLSEIILNFLGLDIDYDIYKEYAIQDNDDINEDNYNDKEEEFLDNINKKISILVKKIFSFIDEITKKRKSFMNFLFNYKELFIKMFINDYIKCKNDELKKIIEEYLSKNCEKSNENLQNFLEIILTNDVFNYLIKNDISGKYLNLISSILKQNFENNETELIIESKIIEQAKKIIDLIINYIQEEIGKNEKEEEDNNNEIVEDKELNKMFKKKENLKEGIIIFLSNILNINSKELINCILTKVDICDFFLNKCILRKCVNKPLEAKKPFCLNNQSKGAVYKLLLNILKNIDNNNDNNILYMKIIEILDNFNILGFWKTFNTRNWDKESKDIQKNKYIGLKNMTSTCYLNSIIQQLFMIPMFRETIIKIENPYNYNVLYELQLLFSALKLYEFPYYSPRSFVLANNLNFYEQMDADEFYGSLIDKLENDIKKIYSKNTSFEESKEESNIKKDNKNEVYKYKNIFNYFFGIKVLDELLFVDCGHKRFNEFCYNNLQLEIKDFSNIYDSLKNYFKTEVMDGDNKINCEQCNEKRTCHKHLLLKTLPNILVISLKRFEFDYNTMMKYKLNKYFEFPLKLDMKDFLIENHSEKNTEYELTGITIHFGVSDFGHYYDIIKSPTNNKWYKFNDTNVSEFKEDDIPKEAFGEKDYSEDDSYKEKENGRNNAYILFYTKKNSSIEILNKTDLALPPYNKYSNLKKDIIDVINLKLYKSWIIKNIFSTSYQNFVMGLLKMNLAKIIDINLEKKYPQLTSIIRFEGYIKNNKENADDKDNNILINININNERIFQFGLRYYFNIILRISRKSQDRSTFDKFKEIIFIYIDSDINKAKYILEEFSKSEAIEEYLVYCPNNNSIGDCIDILNHSIDLLYEKEKDNENSIIYLFFNTYVSYFAYHFRRINLEYVIVVFVKLINLDVSFFIDYLRKKNVHHWVKYCNKKTISQEFLRNIFNESNLPTLKSNHSTLTDKTLISENNLKKIQHDENDYCDQSFYNKLMENQTNEKIREQLYSHFFN